MRDKFPPWIKKSLPPQERLQATLEVLSALSLNTVCQEAGCPNIGECFARKQATFLLLGPYCTRQCAFCAVKKGQPLPADPEEPERVARACTLLGLEHVVITSVTRDDLPLGGASHFAQAIRRVREACPPGMEIEVLVPDFQGETKALEEVAQAEPDIFAHNLETVKSLYPWVRPQAQYERSLAVLRRARALHPTWTVKSGLMLGLGETLPEVEETMEDLLEAGCQSLCIGQYLQPSREQLPVVEFIRPETFDQLAQKAKQLGFHEVASAPFVRSSYRL